MDDVEQKTSRWVGLVIGIEDALRVLVRLDWIPCGMIDIAYFLLDMRRMG